MSAIMSEPLRTLLEGYLRCPTEPARVELEQALRAYQTDWIRTHAGADAPAAPKPATSEPAKAAPKKPKFPIATADLEVLARMADGWVPTIAEVPRWAWFENRELVTLEPNPAGSGPEVMRLSGMGWAAVGRTPPG